MSEVKFNSADYAFITSMLRAREAKMLTQEAGKRMIEAANYQEAAAIAEEFGYPGLRDLHINDAYIALRDCRIAIYNELSRLDEAKLPLDFFRVRFDYHNVKALVKSNALGLPLPALMYNCGRISREKLCTAFNEQDMSAVPKDMTEAIAQARAVLSRTGDPQLSDIAVDKAHFKKRLSIAEDMGAPFIIDYMRMYIDLVNLRTIVRAQRMGRNVEFVRQSIIDGGSVSEITLTQTALTIEETAPLYENTLAQSAAELGLEAIASGGSVSPFEVECDDLRTRYMANAATLRPSPGCVVAYLFGLENELASLRVILGSKAAGLSADVIRERMRKTYA